MLDIGWTELLVIAVVLIVVVGPKDLPPMLRAFGKMTSNLRKMAGDFRSQFDEALKEADMDDVRQTIGDAKRFNPANAIREAINPLREMGNEIRNDLQKVAELPNASAAEPEQGSAIASVDDLIPAPGFALPDTPPIAPAPATVTSTKPASEVAGPATTSPSAVSSVSAPAGAVPSSPPVQASGSVSGNQLDAASKPSRKKKPAAVKLVAPAVPAIAFVEAADVTAVKKTRSRKVSVVEPQLTEASNSEVKTSTRRSAVARAARPAETASVDQTKTAKPVKKKTSVSKDQI